MGGGGRMEGFHDTDHRDRDSYQDRRDYNRGDYNRDYYNHGDYNRGNWNGGGVYYNGGVGVGVDPLYVPVPIPGNTDYNESYYNNQYYNNPNNPNPDILPDN